MLLYTSKGVPMANETLRTIEKRIRMFKRRLIDLGNMRPGTLSVQYRNPAEKKIPFNQISYTHKGKSRSEYVRAENLATVRREIDAYKRFMSLLDQLLELSILASRTRCGTRPAPQASKPAPSGST
jgi:hypothetical protein